MSCDTNSVQAGIERINATPIMDDYDGLKMCDGQVDITGVTVTGTEVTVRGSEKFGSGQTPYADSPVHHISMLERDDVASTEGVVVYEDGPTDDEYPLRLAKQVFFERSHEIPEPESADGLAESVADVLGVDADDFRETVGL